jgi:hypothetical protein
MVSLRTAIFTAAQLIAFATAKTNGYVFGASSSSSSSDDTIRYSIQQVEAHANMGFYAFSYGPSHTFSYQNFLVKLRQPVWLTVTDCYCPGDRFQVFDNGKPIMVTTECPLVTPSCDVSYEDNAWSCLNNPDFCKGVVLLDAGHHNLTIATINSEVGGGAAFIRMDSICPQYVDPYNPTGQPPSCCMYNPYPNLNDYPPTLGRLCNQMVNYPRVPLQ